MNIWLRVLGIIVVLISATGLTGCTNHAPITGRKQFVIVSDATMNGLAETNYREFLQNNNDSRNEAEVARVLRVGHRIQAAVTAYFKNDPVLSSKLSGYQWEFHLIRSQEKNAWCMPGGRIVVYEGLLPVTKDDAGLAVVIAHEVAHAVAGHSAERMSRQLSIGLISAGLAVATKDQDYRQRIVFNALFGVGTTIGLILPNSRQQELEADRLGLIIMALAGYDPHAALDFWKRMSAEKQSSLPIFLRTHPTDQLRIESIRTYIPDAMEYYPSSASGDQRDAFRGE